MKAPKSSVSGEPFLLACTWPSAFLLYAHVAFSLGVHVENERGSSGVSSSSYGTPVPLGQGSTLVINLNYFLKARSSKCGPLAD